ncbi:hypothetical protein [Mycolicibacterium sphagni]|uniref:hypothetical protein n=1 Tax=Mycolicibacterium sphagni TaxID=1786 RepID=UPI0021F2D56B|nr:hypothetical protein [Mycolicibacterium sphagni]MCV7177193.1 hypothetical protein [Mycolicibacterium sphagni]
MTTMMNARREAQQAQFDWGCNRDGWEFEIHNETPVDLVPLYFGSSNLDRVDSPIKAGDIGYAKGIKSPLPPFLFDGPADADLAFRYESTSARIFIQGSADGTITRQTAQDNDQRMSVRFPHTPGDRRQIVVFRWPDLWGPNYNGWEFELTNTTGHDLIYVPDITTNVASCPARIASGATGFLKGKRRTNGGPANCNFAYRHPDHAFDSGGIAIAATSDASRARITGNASGTTDIVYTADTAANVVQRVTYMQR